MSRGTKDTQIKGGPKWVVQLTRWQNPRNLHGFLWSFCGNLALQYCSLLQKLPSYSLDYVIVIHLLWNEINGHFNSPRRISHYLSNVEHSTIPPICCDTNGSSSSCSAGLDNLLMNWVDRKEWVEHVTMKTNAGWGQRSICGLSRVCDAPVHVSCTGTICSK